MKNVKEMSIIELEAICAKTIADSVNFSKGRRRTVYEVEKVIGTKRQPYGMDHGHYDSTVVGVPIKDYVRVDREEYEAYKADYVSIYTETPGKRKFTETYNLSLNEELELTKSAKDASLRQRRRDIIEELVHNIFQVVDQLYNLADEWSSAFLEDKAYRLEREMNEFQAEWLRLKKMDM